MGRRRMTDFLEVKSRFEIGPDSMCTILQDTSTEYRVALVLAYRSQVEGRVPQDWQRGLVTMVFLGWLHVEKAKRSEEAERALVVVVHGVPWGLNS